MKNISIIIFLSLLIISACQKDINEFFKGITHSNFSAEGNSYVEITMLDKDNSHIMQSAEGARFTFLSKNKI